MGKSTTPDVPHPGLLDRLFGIDLRSVALLRMGLGGILLWDLVDRARFLEAHYTDSGLYPREASVAQWSGGEYWERLWAFASLHMASGDMAWQVFLFLCTAVCAFCLLVGYRARLFACLCWLLTISIQNRNPHILSGADQMIRHLLFWAMFLPLGGRFSVDGLCALCKAYQQPVPTRALSLGTAGILLQTLLLYWFTAALKSAPEWRGEGTAIYYALSIEHYQTVPGRWMLGMPLIFLKLATWGAIALEAFGPIVAFLPFAVERLRLGVVAVFVFFHLVLIAGLMDVGPISETSVLMWIAFLPALFWEKLAALWRRLPASRVKAGMEAAYQSIVAWRNGRIRQRVERREPLPELQATKLTQAVAALSIVFIALWNLRGMDAKRFGHYTDNLTWVANLVRLDQNWAMFAPFPFKQDGWFVLVATLSEGSQVDLLQGGKPVRWEKPAPVASQYVNERERKYLMNLYEPSYESQRGYFMHYKIREWRRSHPQITHRVVKIDFYYLLHRTPPPGSRPPEPRKLLLWSETYTKV